MRSPSIEWLHAKLDRRIKLAQAYSDIPELNFIIKACRLKPYHYVFGEHDDKITLYKWWFDEFGNTLTLVKSKRLLITYNDLRISKEQIIGTDLYGGLSLDRVAKMSKLVHVVLGKDEDLYQDCCLISFLGIDDHIRSYLYWYGEWQQVSPLLMGMKHLKLLANHLDIKHYVQLGNKENSTIPCVSGSAWISYLPASDAFCSEMDKQLEVIAGLLKT